MSTPPSIGIDIISVMFPDHPDYAYKDACRACLKDAMRKIAPFCRSDLETRVNNAAAAAGASY